MVHTIGNKNPGGEKGGLAIWEKFSMLFPVMAEARIPVNKGIAMLIRKVFKLNFINKILSIPRNTTMLLENIF